MMQGQMAQDGAIVSAESRGRGSFGWGGGWTSPCSLTFVTREGHTAICE